MTSKTNRAKEILNKLCDAFIKMEDEETVEVPSQPVEEKAEDNVVEYELKSGIIAKVKEDNTIEFSDNSEIDVNSEYELKDGKFLVTDEEGKFKEIIEKEVEEPAKEDSEVEAPITLEDEAEKFTVTIGEKDFEVEEEVFNYIKELENKQKESETENIELRSQIPSVKIEGKVKTSVNTGFPIIKWY